MSVRRPAFFRRWARACEGTTAIEFAMVLPLFIVIAFGTFQFGMAQHRLFSLRYALNTTARAVMLNPAMTQTQASDMTKALLTDIADPNVTVTLAVVNGAAGKVARLTGTYSSYIGVPTLATFPLSYQTTVDTTLPS